MQADVHRAAKAARERRERRYYTPDKLGEQCRDRRCSLRVPAALNAAGIYLHPTCGPQVQTGPDPRSST